MNDHLTLFWNTSGKIIRSTNHSLTISPNFFRFIHFPLTIIETGFGEEFLQAEDSEDRKVWSFKIFYSEIQCVSTKLESEEEAIETENKEENRKFGKQTIRVQWNEKFAVITREDRNKFKGN